MGLANDPNKAIKIPSYKEEQLKKAKKIVNPEESESEEPKLVKSKPRKNAVVEKLEQEAHAPRERRFK